MSVSATTTTLTWERYTAPIERWCLVPNDSDHRERYVRPYRTACGEIIDAKRWPMGRATIDATQWSCDCRGVSRRPHLHADPWPSRAVAGRIPLCLDCVAIVRNARVEPSAQ